MKNEPIIQIVESFDAFSLAKLAEKSFRGAFAKLNDKENFETYVALSLTENQIRSEILDSASTFFIAKLNDEWVGYVRFLYIAYGSVCELETQTMISGDLDYMKKERLQELREELGDVERMLKAMIKSLENKHLNP